MTINITEVIRKMMGWCPNAAMLNKKEDMYMVSYEGKYIDKIKGMGLRGFLGILNLVFGVLLILTALVVLARQEMFPWWAMDLNLISSGILLTIGVFSLLIFFNFIKSANMHRILALANIILLIAFSLYLSQFLIRADFNFSLIPLMLYYNYSFNLLALLLFTFTVAIPSILTLFSKPAGETKKGFITATLLIFIILFASLGVYYLYLNKQKDSMQSEEFGDGRYKLYSLNPGASWGTTFGGSIDSYFIDSAGDTTGHPISEETYEAIQFLKNKEGNKVLSWWDYELEIKAAGKEPVISYASKAIEGTIARPASLYDKFEPDEKVADVSTFFATNSEDVAKSIAEKYKANLVYISRQRINDLIPVMVSSANPDFDFQNPDIRTPEAYFENVIKPTMAYKFTSGEELKYFDKILENKDVMIYQLK